MTYHVTEPRVDYPYILGRLNQNVNRGGPCDAVLVLRHSDNQRRSPRLEENGSYFSV